MSPSSPDTSDPLDVEVPKDQRRAHLWGYFRRYIWWFLSGAVALVITNILGLAIPEQIGIAVQNLKDAADTASGLDASVQAGLVTVGVTIIGLAIGAAIARIFSRILIFNAGRFIEYDVRNELYTKLTQLDQTFYSLMPTGDITSRVTNDVSYIRLLYALSFLHIVNTTLAYGIALRKMVGIDWELTLWCLAPYPFMLVVLFWIIRELFLQTKVVQSQLSDLSTKVQENLSGMSLVKTFNLQRREQDQFDTMSDEFYGKSMRLALIRGALNALMIFVAGTGTLIVLWVGSGKITSGSLTLGQFVEFNGYVVSLAFPTSAMGWVFSVWQRGQAAFDRVQSILYRPSALPDPDAPEDLPDEDAVEAVGEIRFDGVTFGYDARPKNDLTENLDHEIVLRDIDLTIPAGSTVAVVGKTGSGKSTLVKLIARLYDPDQGRVLVDGVDVRDLDARTLRSHMGFVPQDPFLFSMTIGQNMRFGLDALDQDPTIDADTSTRSLLDPSKDGLSQNERIEEAVDVAGLRHDIDSFPKGLETLVGERGITLSGGQKQRVTIARALLTDPRVLVLDDALSSVDTQTESVILDHLDTLMEGRTSVILTHRYNALTRVDKIFVMEQGRIVESGSHDDLIDARGVYAQMYEQQKLRESLEE